MQLPALGIDTNLLSGTSGLDAFRQGEQDQIGQNKRNLLKKVGGQAATENYLQAAQTAMRGGEIDTGLGLLKTKATFDASNTEQRFKLLDFAARNGAAADTPEKWDALVTTMQNVYGPDADLSPYRDFNKREEVIRYLNTTKEGMERQQQQVDLELSRDKLTGQREDRAFKSNIISQFMPPAGASPAPSYTPSPRAEAPSMAPAAPPPVAGPTPQIAQPAPAAPPSTQDIIAKMSPTQRTALGLLLAKEDYAGAAKLLKEAGGGMAGEPFGMSGYRWSATTPGELEAIGGGPASKLPAETAGKVGMMRTALQSLPFMRNIFLGDEVVDKKTGQPKRKGTTINAFDYYANRGMTGEGYRLGVGAIESVLRAASGAAVPETEVTRYSTLFLPSYMDNDETKVRKLDSLERWIGNMLDAIQTGRPVDPSEVARVNQAKTAGRLSSSPQAPDGAQGSIPVDPLQEAREAIELGADPEAVMRRLEENGIDPSGL
jgi:hypothetical protein